MSSLEHNIPSGSESALHFEVYACIVTYNRAALLDRLLKSLADQSFPISKIIIVDNASTDNTASVVRSRVMAKSPDIEYIRLATNSGGAGGFATAITAAMTRYSPRPTHLWLMDDDGYPAPDCLELLIRAFRETRHAALNPIIWSDAASADGHNELAFGHGSQSNKRLHAAIMDDRTKILTGLAQFFNGTLLATPMIEKIGVPIADFFIWGDEVEYQTRMKQQGFAVATVLEANFFHPKSRQKAKYYKLGPIRWIIPEVPEARKYYLIRNYAYIAYQYKGFSGWLRHLFKWLIYSRTHPGLVIKWAVEGAKMSRDGISKKPW